MLQRKTRFHEVSHPIYDGMVTYKGLREARVSEYVSRKTLAILYSEGIAFQLDRVDLIGNTGTFLNSPFHRFPKGDDISCLPLEKLANLDCLVVNSKATELSHQVNLALLVDYDVRDKAVLIATGWSRYWGTDSYYDRPPYLTVNAAKYLAAHGAALVGIDSPNIDDITKTSRPVNTILLRHNIPFIEHMINLENVPATGGKFFAVPPRIEKVGCFPVRAFVIANS